MNALTGAIYRGGRTLPGFALGAEYAAQDEVLRRIGRRPSWGRGVGLTRVRDAHGQQRDAVLVQVQKPEHVAIARRIVGGDQVLGTPVVYQAVGDFVALAAVAAPTDPYSAASVQLSELLAQVYAAKKLIDSQNYQGAVAAFQNVGNQAASSLGPQIDQGPYPATTQPLTHDAWTVNASLAAITGSDVTAAQQAAAAVDQMMADYSGAINAAHAAMGVAPRTAQPATWPYVLFAGAVVAAGGTALYLKLGH